MQTQKEAAMLTLKGGLTEYFVYITQDFDLNVSWYFQCSRSNINVFDRSYFVCSFGWMDVWQIRSQVFRSF